MNSVIQAYEQHVNPALARLFRFMGLGSTAVRAEGSYVYDEDGRAFLDFLGNFGVFSLGHRHPRVVEAVRAQLDSLPQTARYLLDRPVAQLAELLAAITPGDLQYSFFCNSGTEAVEAAIKLSRLATGKSGIISTVNSFHGKTLGSLSVSGRDLFREPCKPLVPDILHVYYGDVDAIERVLRDRDDIAAFIVEPIQGEGGIIVPSEGYLAKVQALCRQHEIVLIADEVQTGLGRTGYMFACESENVVPDILCLAKALGGGVMPIGAIVGRPQVWQPLIDNPWIHSSTFGGNPLACVAAAAAIQATLEEDLPRQAKEKGEFLLNQLKNLAKEYPRVIAEARGRGLLIGLEFIREGVGGLVISRMVEQQIIVGYALNNPGVIRLEPPLNVAQEDMEKVLAVLADAVAEADQIIEEL